MCVCERERERKIDWKRWRNKLIKSRVGVRENESVRERDQENEECNLCTLRRQKERDRDRERERAGVQPLNPAYPLAPSVSGLHDSS